MNLPKRSMEIRDALAVYGYTLMSSRKYESACELYRGMAVLFPDDRHVSVSLVVASHAAGHAADTLSLAERLMPTASAQELAILDYIRGKALFATGRREQALEAFTGALTRREPSKVPARGGGA